MTRLFPILAVVQDTSAQATFTVAGTAALATALVTVAAALLYLLGLITLGWPIYQITKDSSTALYAVSLISKLVVAGQGIRIIGYPLAANVIVVVLMSCFFALSLLLNTLFAGFYPDIVGDVLAIAVLLLFLTVLTKLPKWLTSKWPRSANFWKKVSEGYWGPPGGYREMGLLNSFRLVVFLSTAISIYALSFGTALVEDLGFEGVNNLTSLWRVVLIILILFAGAFIVSMPEALSHEVPLPQARVIQAEKATVGTLLNHSGGVWHLLTEDGILTAIPDGKVEVVRVYAARPNARTKPGGRLKARPGNP